MFLSTGPCSSLNLTFLNFFGDCPDFTKLNSPLIFGFETLSTSTFMSSFSR